MTIRRVLGMVILLAAAVPAMAQSTQLSLKQAVDEALMKNDRLVDQQDVTTQADLGVRLARSTFRPKIVPNINGSFGQTDITSQNYRVDLTQRLTTGTELRLGVGTSTAQIPGTSPSSEADILFYNADTTLTLSQPLLRGLGRTVARRQLTSAELRKADAGRQRTMAEQQVAIDVATAYYGVVAQRAFVAVARQSVERSIKLRDASEAKLTAGLVSQLDVLRAQQLVAQAEIQLFDALSATDDARDRLLFLVGRQPGDDVDVDAAVPPVDNSTIDVDAAIELALQNRLDLRSRAEAGIDAEGQVSWARNQLLPQVDVNLALTRRGTSQSFTDSFGLDRFQFATFFTIAMPVDRTAQQVDFQNAMIERNRRRRDVTTLERQIRDDVRRSVRDRDRLQRQVIAAQTAVDISRQEVEVARMRYENGLSNNLDVVPAESGLLGAESRRIQALVDSALMRLRLRAVLGTLDPRTDIQQ
ncbi:MAG: TolC family protein [Acidimicrobiia bacterium]